MEEGCGCGCGEETCGGANDCLRVDVPCERSARLPLAEVVGDVLRDCECGIRGAGLGVPLASPAKAGGEGEIGAEFCADVRVEGEVCHGAVVPDVAGDEGLLEAAWSVVDEVWQGVVVEAAVEVLVLLFVGRVDGETGAEGELVASARESEIFAEL